LWFKEGDVVDFNSSAIDYNTKIKEEATSFGATVTDRVLNYVPSVIINAPTGSCSDFSFVLPLTSKTYKIKFKEHIDKLAYLSVLFYFFGIFGAVIIVLSTS
jgi:hypothetical protein